MIQSNRTFFSPWESIHEGNPQEILDRGEKVALVPFLIMQGALDDNVLPAMQERFAEAYRAAGGACDYRLFEDSTHEWVAVPGPQTDKAQELSEVARALSYSPSREADQVMLDLAASNKNSAGVVAPHSVRRMVIGPKGYGDITSTQRMDFAEAMLKHSLDSGIIRYLGRVHEARALRALMFCLEKGVESAAQNLVSSAEGMEKLSPADAKIAAKAIQDVIEYIEVTRLRGEVQAHMSKDDKYAEWKELQARAGKALLKVHKPETAPIPGFDPLELDP